MILRLLSTILLTALTVASVFAQDDPTGFAGVVYSISKERPIRGATVRYTAADPSGPIGTVRADENGRYAVVDIPPGTYTFVIEAKGYDVREDVDTAVVPGAVTPLDVGLTGPGPPPRGSRSFIAFAIGGIALLVVMTRSQMKNRKLLSRDDDERPRRKPPGMEHW